MVVVVPATRAKDPSVLVEVEEVEEVEVVLAIRAKDPSALEEQLDLALLLQIK